MKTCEEMLFGISIDEHILFKASLALLCFLSLVLMLISILIIWLKKIQRQIVGLTENTWSLPLLTSKTKAENCEEQNSWTNLWSSAVYELSSFDGDGPRSDLIQETSFDNSLAQGNDEKSVHDSNTQEESIASDNNNASNVQNVDDSSAAHHPMSNDSERDIKGGKLKKDYMSLKGARDHTYAKPGADSARVESKMGCEECQNRKALNEQKNGDGHQDDHGYLVVIHSDESSALSDGTENEKPPYEDESSYLIPIQESKLKENGHHKMESKIGTEPEGKRKANGVSIIDDRVPPLDEKNDGPVSPGHGDYYSYAYMQTKDWTELVDHNNSTTGKAKPVTKSSTDYNHEYNAVHETEVNLSKEQEYSTDQIYSIIHDSNNTNNASVQSDREVVYVNQNGVQNPGVEYSDDVPVYANEPTQQQSSVCNDNPAFKFCNVDDIPVYENP